MCKWTVQTLAAVWFGLIQYLWLTGFALSAYGAGALLVDRCPAAATWPFGLRTLLTLAAGIGVLVLCLLALAIPGLFTPLPVAAVLTVALAHGALAFGRRVRAWHDQRGPGASVWPRGADPWFWLAIGALVALPLLLRPLQPPRGWDELMYHLPHARAWADAGRLTTATAFRFPLFPYNVDLLYAAALLFGNDVLPHLVHALAGVLVACGLVAAGSRYFTTAAGLVAGALFLASAAWGFGVAYVDLGLTLFVAYAFLTLALWYEGDDDRLAALAAFFLGLAVGTKYQALLFVPIVGFWIVRRSRRPRVLAIALLAFVAGGGCWYARSFVVSGDPFHPFGGPLFGYWLWDRRDLAAVVSATRGQGGWPKWYMAPALLALVFLSGSSGVYRALCASGCAALTIWPIFSWHERYLMPAYPLLAMMAGVAVVRTAAMLDPRRLGVRVSSAWTRAVRIAVLLLVAAWSLPEARDAAARIAPTPAQRDALLGPELDGYEMFRALPPGPAWRLYQFGFEGELYYAPVPVVGDWVGAQRYRAVFDLAADPPALAAWLESLGVNGLLVNTRRTPFAAVRFGPGFDAHFELVAETPSARLYRLR